VATVVQANQTNNYMPTARARALCARDTFLCVAVWFSVHDYLQARCVDTLWRARLPLFVPGGRRHLARGVSRVFHAEVGDPDLALDLHWVASQAAGQRGRPTRSGLVAWYAAQVDTPTSLRLVDLAVFHLHGLGTFARHCASRLQPSEAVAGLVLVPDKRPRVVQERVGVSTRSAGAWADVASLAGDFQFVEFVVEDVLPRWTPESRARLVAHLWDPFAGLQRAFRLLGLALAHGRTGVVRWCLQHAHSLGVLYCSQRDHVVDGMHALLHPAWFDRVHTEQYEYCCPELRMVPVSGVSLGRRLSTLRSLASFSIAYGMLQPFGQILAREQRQQPDPAAMARSWGLCRQPDHEAQAVECVALACWLSRDAPDTSHLPRRAGVCVGDRDVPAEGDLDLSGWQHKGVDLQ